MINPCQTQYRLVNIGKYKLALLLTRDTLTPLQMQSHTCTSMSNILC